MKENELYNKIIDRYKTTRSIKKTATSLSTYPIKVRRVLITEGLWSSKTSDKIEELHDQGLTPEQIAKKLVISVKNVQSYLPYTRGQYNKENCSNDAVRSKGYRKRMLHAAKMQVNRRTDEMAEDHIMSKKKQMGETKVNVDEWMAKQQNAPFAMQLHLELDMENAADEDIEILQKYGKMDKAISRDLIIPGDMTLHALHYAINKAFGWQNSHLHSFRPYEEDFIAMTKQGKMEEWGKLAGVYFRFPSDDFQDLYWDDDYKVGISVKTWLRKKYTGPYYYGGTKEFYLECQKEVREFFERYPMLEVRKSFHDWYEEKRALAEETGRDDMEPEHIQKVIPSKMATIDEAHRSMYFDGWFDEFLERIPLRDILVMPDKEQDWKAWDFSKRSILKQCGKNLQENLEALNKLHGRQNNRKNNGYADLLKLTTPLTLPAIKELRYCYDYGDNWNVKITCTECWYDVSRHEPKEESSQISGKRVVKNSGGNEESDAVSEKLINVADKLRGPICIAADGLSLVDDVGGIRGFCEMLRALHGNDPEEKESYRTWAGNMGWTGRNAKPENML